MVSLLICASAPKRRRRLTKRSTFVNILNNAAYGDTPNNGGKVSLRAELYSRNEQHAMQTKTVGEKKANKYSAHRTVAASDVHLPTFFFCISMT